MAPSSDTLKWVAVTVAVATVMATPAKIILYNKILRTGWIVPVSACLACIYLAADLFLHPIQLWPLAVVVALLGFDFMASVRVISNALRRIQQNQMDGIGLRRRMVAVPAILALALFVAWKCAIRR